MELGRQGAVGPVPGEVEVLAEGVVPADGWAVTVRALAPVVIVSAPVVGRGYLIKQGHLAMV